MHPFKSQRAISHACAIIGLICVLCGCQQHTEYTTISLYSLLAIPERYDSVKVETSGFLTSDDLGRWLLYPNKDLGHYKNLENAVSLGREGISSGCEGHFVVVVVTFKPFSGIYLEAEKVHYLDSLDNAKSCLVNNEPMPNNMQEESTPPNI